MNDISPVTLPDQDNAQSLHSRVRELRSHLQPEKAPDGVKLKKACQDFEAVFIAQIWKQMRSSVPKDEMLHSKEEESYLSMFDQELSVKMAGAGGIGLSEMLYSNLSERLKGASKDATSSNPLRPLQIPERQDAQPLQPRTLATLAAQHEAEMLARNLEQTLSNSDAVKAARSAELDTALHVVSME